MQQETDGAGARSTGGQAAEPHCPLATAGHRNVRSAQCPPAGRRRWPRRRQFPAAMQCNATGACLEVEGGIHGVVALRRIGSCTRDPLPETMRTRCGDSSRRGTDAGGIRSGLPPMPIALIHSPRGWLERARAGVYHACGASATSSWGSGRSIDTIRPRLQPGGGDMTWSTSICSEHTLRPATALVHNAAPPYVRCSGLTHARDDPASNQTVLATGSTRGARRMVGNAQCNHQVAVQVHCTDTTGNRPTLNHECRRRTGRDGSASAVWDLPDCP